MRCRKHGLDLVTVPCPDKQPGCLVAHFKCSKCDVEREEREILAALQEANGLPMGNEPSSEPEGEGRGALGTLWGIWGGRSPGGWCAFRTSHPSRDVYGYGFIGSEAEAKSGIVELSNDHPENRFSFTTVPYDEAREPAATRLKSIATSAPVIRNDARDRVDAKVCGPLADDILLRFGI